MSGHTPTPWFLRNEDAFPNTPEGWVLEGVSSGRWIATFPRLVREERKQHIADAHYIVQCVNVHDELVEACKKAFGVLAGDDMNKQALIDALTMCRAAIAKAGSPT